MSKEIFIKKFIENAEKNYEHLYPYYNHSLMSLAAINPIKNEIINCLMIEQYIAAINCTNHFLERLMKLTLIENFIKGIKYDEAEKLTAKLDIAYEKYDGLDLWESIDKCYKEAKLISKKEFDQLNKIKKNIRNSYSHAQMLKVNIGIPKSIPKKIYSFKKVIESLKNGSEINHNNIQIPTKAPSIQTQFQKTTSKDLAIIYFKTVYQIAQNIDVKLDVNKEYYK